MQDSEQLIVKSGADADAILRIRKLLLGAEYEDLLALKSCLNNPEALSEKIASIISEAISQRITLDQSLSEVLAPTIDVAIQKSIARDPNAIAVALYPVMGPAIRKSISETLVQMLEGINQLLESSFSPRALGWRFDAWRSGRSYSEIVLMHTLEFQVEQLFLIHNETSLLLQHVVADMALSKDPDIVSSMLSAIQDYIHDSFAVDASENLKSLRLGDVTVVVEKGPTVVLAAVVRGKAPADLDNVFKHTVEVIHRRYGSQLKAYSGNADAFAALEPTLRECLIFRKQEVAVRKTPWKALLLLLLTMGGLGYLYYRHYELTTWQATAIDNLKHQPGIVVTDSGVDKNGAIRVSGLRDPLSQDPKQVALATLPKELAINFSFESYFSLDPQIVETRIQSRLQPPQGVTLALEKQRLIISGTADIAWIKQLKEMWPSIHGIEQIDISALRSFDPVLDELVMLRQQVENLQFDFAPASTEFSGNAGELAQLALSIKRMLSLAQARQLNLAILILGDTDDTGTDKINLRIASQRAEAVADALLKQQVPAEIIQTHSLRDVPLYDQGLQQRRVFFKVTGIPGNSG